MLAALLALSVGAPSAAAADETAVSAQVGAGPYGQAMPPGFVGISLEYKAVHIYTGRDPTRVDPVFVALLRNLAPGQAPVIRIGGNSTDNTWWPLPGVIPPGGVGYGLTKGWMRTTQALAQALGGHLIMGIDLAADRPAIAAAEARSLLEGIGTKYIQALEIGNEADLYGTFPWYRDRRGRVYSARPPTYDFDDYLADFAHWRAAMPPVPLAGPAFAAPNWMGGLDTLLSSEPSLRIVTFHRYPLRACVTNPSDPLFPSPTNLLTDQASGGLAQQLAPYVATAHAHGATFRLDELNSAACKGRFGVSNAFVSALWALDTLFNLASVGVDGVNIHTLPSAPYEPFTFTERRNRWSAFVHPIYYGLLMFAEAFPPGARLLPVAAPAGPVKVWATQAPDGHTRVVVINKQPSTPVTVQLRLPGAQSTASTESLLAPSIRSVIGVTLAGRTFGLKTTSGKLPLAPRTSAVSAATGVYNLNVRAGSAMMLTQ
jgi:hypothetical protein